jgi:hypothetical protein
VGRQDLLLIPYDRFLIPENLELVPDHHWQALLIVENLRLVPDDYPFIRDDRLLILECRLCHCLASLGSMSGMTASFRR